MNSSDEIDDLDPEMSDEPDLMIVCQGPPRCSLQGDDAVKAQKDGCIWCDRLYFTGDREFKIGPGDKLH